MLREITESTIFPLSSHISIESFLAQVDVKTSDNILMGMRFLVLSDVHSSNRTIAWANRLAREHGADAFIVLGDIVNFSPADWAEEFLKSLDLPAYAVPGNCDPPAVVGYIERAATSLHQRKAEVGGKTFIGLGGSNPTIFDTPFELEEDAIAEKLGPLMEEGAVMVLHCPPYGILDKVRGGKSVGSTAILDLVKRYRPRVVLSGHIHEDRGVLENNGTLFMNPGAAKDGFSALLDIGDEIRGVLLDQVIG